MESISLVLPMFNEKDYIDKAISKALSVLESIALDFEIIIVDDASNDGSEKKANLLSAGDRRIKVVHHIKNRKLGGALKSGFSQAAKEIIIYTDMDMPFDFSLLGEFVRLIDGSDIINGYRNDYRESFKRRLYSKVYNALIRFLFGLKVRDVNFAMKIFKREALDALKLNSEGSFINAEALIKAQYAGYRIREVAVEYSPRNWGRSRLSSPAVIIKIICEMLRFYPTFAALRVKAASFRFRAGIHNFIRLKTCPFKLIEAHIPSEGDIYDLGCGYGTLINFLCRLPNGRRRFIGLDIDEAKIGFALRENKDRNIIFEPADVSRGLSINNASCIAMIDLLMLLTFEEQEKLLGRCWKYLSENGVLLIKDVDTQPLWKYAWHQFQETLVLKVFRLIKGKGIYCRCRRDYVNLLERIGYKVKVADIQKGYPYPHILYICSKQ